MSAPSVAYQKLDAPTREGGKGNQTLHCRVPKKPIKSQLPVHVNLHVHDSLRGLLSHNLRTVPFVLISNSFRLCREVNSYTFRKIVVVLLL